MIELLLLISIFLVSAGLGKKVFSFFGFEFGSFLEELLFSTALGLGLLSIFTFVLGILKLLYPLYAYLLLLFCALFSFQEIVSVLKNLWKSRKKIKWRDLSLFNKTVILILAFCFLVLLISTYNPPIDGDVMLYHLAVPKIYLKNHAIIYIPYNFLSNTPFLVQTLFLLALLLKSDLLSQQIHLLFVFLSFLATFLIARRYFSFSLSLLASGIFLTIPTVLYLASIAFVDFALSFFFSLSLYAYFAWKEALPEKWIYVSAIMAGFTAACKYQGFTPALLLGFFFLVESQLRKSSANFLLKIFFKYYLFALLPVAPWLIKNFVYTGNPVFPLAYKIFGGRDWNPTVDMIMTRLNLELFFEVLRNLPFLPWAATMDPKLLIGKLGPVFLAFIPVAFFFPEKSEDINLARLFLFIGTLIGLFLLYPDAEIRYLSPILPLLSVVSAIGAIKLSEKGVLIKIGVSSLLVLAFLINFAVLVSSFFRPPGSYPPTKSLKAVFGLERREEYLLNVLPYYQAFLFINKNLPNNAKVLILGGREAGMSGYYLEREYLWGSLSWQAYIDYWHLKTAEEIYQEYKKKGVTHIFFEKHSSTLDPKLQAPFVKDGETVINRIKEVLTQFARVVYEDKEYRVYQLN